MCLDPNPGTDYVPAACEYFTCKSCNKLYKVGSKTCPHCGANIVPETRVLVTGPNGKPMWIPASAVGAWKKGQSMSQEELDQRKADLLKKLKERTPALRRGTAPDPPSKDTLSPDPMTDYARRLEKEIAGLREEYAAKSKMSSDLIEQQHLQIENMTLRHQRSHFIVCAVAVAFCLIFSFIYTFTSRSSTADYDDVYNDGYSAGYDQGYIDCSEDPDLHDYCIGYEQGYEDGATEESYLMSEEARDAEFFGYWWGYEVGYSDGSNGLAFGENSDFITVEEFNSR